MSIVSANNLGVSFGAFDLFRGITVNIPNNGKIGLIGPNGIGKTSLLLIMAGINTPTSGDVHLARGRRLGYLRQEAVDAFADRDNTVYTEMQTVFAGLQARQERLHEMEALMAGGQYDETFLEEYGVLQAAFDRDGGYEVDLRIQQTLSGLGLGKDTWEMPLRHLSGGQKTRALLARLLLEKPDLLMLDEPTNHLDIEAVEWLERILREWEGAVLIVSHDRYFLDNTVSTIWEMSPTGIQEFSGNYSAYLLQRQERWEYAERVFEEEKARLAKEVDFIQRNWVRASTHARALGLLRRISRDLAIVEQFGVLALRSGKQWSEFGISVERPLDVIEAVRKVNAIQLNSPRPPAIRPRLAAAPPSGTIVLRARHLQVGYPGNPLFSIPELELRRGECAALIGPNGSGKTTFLKVLLGQLDPLKGSVELGPSIKIGYFAQAHDSLNSANSVIEELQRHKEMDDGQARSLLAQYLFRGEDVFKPVSALSGGERARLALAILALDGANLLLLDEPTNHLDIPAREALQEVLDAYPGTVLLVSHDRYLVDRLATQVWGLRERRLVIFHGSYREFVLRRPAASGSAQAARQVLLPAKPMLRGNGKEIRQKAQTLSQLEGRIREQEQTIQRLSLQLQKHGSSGKTGRNGKNGKNGANSYEQLHDLSWQMAQAQAALDSLLSDWEKAAS